MMCEPARSPGLSLTEMLVATGIISLIFVGVTGTIAVEQPFASEGMSRATLQVRSSMAGDAVTQELSRGKLGIPAPVGTSVVYQLPMDPDGDGEFLDDQGQVEWGMTLGGVDVVGATGTFQYVADDQLDESVVGEDLNGDGDQDDLLDRGHLERVLSDGQVHHMSGSWILQPAGNHGGDLDGDLQGDPIFQVVNSGNRDLLRVDFTVVSPVSPRRWTSIRNRYTVSLRNEDN